MRPCLSWACPHPCFEITNGAVHASGEHADRRARGCANVQAQAARQQEVLQAGYGGEEEGEGAEPQGRRRGRLAPAPAARAPGLRGRAGRGQGARGHGARAARARPALQAWCAPPRLRRRRAAGWAGAGTLSMPLGLWRWSRERSDRQCKPVLSKCDHQEHSTAAPPQSLQQRTAQSLTAFRTHPRRTSTRAHHAWLLSQQTSRTQDGCDALVLPEYVGHRHAREAAECLGARGQTRAR